MRHRVNRTDFLQILNRVQPGLSVRAFIEQSSCFVFEKGWVITFNDEICCRTLTGLPHEFKGAVKAEPLLRLFTAMSDDEVHLEPTKAELRVYGVRKQAGVRMESEILLPHNMIAQPKKWVVLPEDFGAAIEPVVETAGTNEEEFICTCVHLHPEFLETCDRQQVTRYNMEIGLTSPVLVRAKSLLPVATLGVTKMGQTENWIHFRNTMLVYSCRIHVGEFFNTDPYLDVNGTPATLPMCADEAVNGGEIFSGDDKKNDRVLVMLTDGKMTLRGEGLSGWFESACEMSYHGPDVSFRVSPKRLKQLVKKTSECTIGEGRLWVLGERWSYATSLGAVNAAPDPDVSVVGSDDDVETQTEESDDGDVS